MGVITEFKGSVMDVRQIVSNWLEVNGYDGLFQPGECACKNDDLYPCGEMTLDCQPGYLKPAGNCSVHEWHIGSKDGDDACGEGNEA